MAMHPHRHRHGRMGGGGANSCVHLRDMAVGQRGRVVGYRAGNPTYRKRLLQMGLVRGAEFEFLRLAPLGDPVVIRLCGFSLTLRKDEADMVEIERLG
ncbi:MAG: Ferrous iron transport protein A [Lentisphaerae bacterium ADurb.BinA184]|nr:MAG: Ferrous iron transport protein A [Lentisphaerae bacterium ADurb.BinA184]